MYNHTGIMGRLTADPELRYTESEIPVCSFSIAHHTGKKDASGQDVAEFFRVVAWRKRAEFVAKYLSKGRLILVEGKLRARTWVADDGTSRPVVEIVASAIHFADSKKAEGSGAEPAPQGIHPGPDDFEEIDPDDDLPF